MGLDMFAYKTFEEIDSVDFQYPQDREEFFYWRKHPNLHGWFENLYKSKGGKDEKFTGPVKITKSDLVELEHDIRYKFLPETSGFFFGKSDHSEEEELEDLKFVFAAAELLKRGHSIFYSSSW